MKKNCQLRALNGLPIDRSEFETENMMQEENMEFSAIPVANSAQDFYSDEDESVIPTFGFANQ